MTQASWPAPIDFPRLPGLVFQRRLGCGGQGTVWQAQRRTAAFGLCTTVAVKVVEFDQGGVREEVFRTEAAVSLCVAHDGLIAGFDAGRSADSGYLVMEWVDGVDLRTLCRLLAGAGRRLPPRLACHIVARLLVALDYLHALEDGGRWLGLVHCDVSPRNVLVSGSGAVKLGDFGAVHRRGRPQTTRRGTPPYMAPEQRDGLVFDQRADLYAAGALLEALLPGGRCDRADASCGQPRLPDAVQAIAEQLRAPRPVRRPASALKAATILDRWAGPHAQRDLAKLAASVMGRSAPQSGSPRRHEGTQTLSDTRTLTGNRDRRVWRWHRAATVGAASLLACATLVAAV